MYLSPAMIHRDRARRRLSLALQEETPEVEGLALRVSVCAYRGACHEWPESAVTKVQVWVVS